MIASSEIKVDNVYRTPTENHHPMEPHATVAVWDAPDKLTIYDSTQGVKNCQGSTAYLFGLKPENVHVISPFVGGGFGCKGGQWPHIAIAVMSAKAVGKPVKLNVTRQMMVTNVGRRPETIQRVAIGTDKSGKMTALLHHTDTYKSVSEYFERAGVPSTVLYGARVREITYKVAKLNVGPTFMRAPGETPGSFALESAMDELAVALNMDPIALRVLNHTLVDPLQKNPSPLRISSTATASGPTNSAGQAQTQNPRPVARAATFTASAWPPRRIPQTAAVRSHAFRSNRTARPRSGALAGHRHRHVHDHGPDRRRTCSAFRSKKITVNIGDSLLPQGPGSGGSQTAVSVTSAVLATAEELKKQMIGMAVNDTNSRLHGHGPDSVEAADSRLFVRDDRSINELYTDILKPPICPTSRCA